MSVELTELTQHITQIHREFLEDETTSYNLDEYIAKKLHARNYRQLKRAKLIKPTRYSDMMCGNCSRPHKITNGVYCTYCGALFEED